MQNHEIIKRFREDHSLDMEEMGKKLGVHESYISHLEGQRCAPGRELAKRIMKLTGAPMDQWQNIQKKKKAPKAEPANPDREKPEEKVIFNGLIAYKSEGCVDCEFYKECSDSIRHIIKIIAPEYPCGEYIFKLKRSWAPCPVDVKIGQSLHYKPGKIYVAAISQIIDAPGTWCHGQILVRPLGGGESAFFVDLADLEMEVL